MPKSLRQIRTEFSKKHANTSKVIKLMTKGKSTNEIANQLQLKVGSVRTIRGNLTRGAYLPYVQMVDGKVTGTCNY